METTIIQIPIYNHTLQVLLGDVTEIKDTLVREYKVAEHWADGMLENIGANAAGSMCRIDAINEYFLWVEKVPTTIKDYGVLVHEIEHFVFYFLNDKGLNHTEDSDEAYAYLFEYIFEQIDTWITIIRKDENDGNKDD